MTPVVVLPAGIIHVLRNEGELERDDRFQMLTLLIICTIAVSMPTDIRAGQSLAVRPRQKHVTNHVIKQLMNYSLYGIIHSCQSSCLKYHVTVTCNTGNMYELHRI